MKILVLAIVMALVLTRCGNSTEQRAGSQPEADSLADAPVFPPQLIAFEPFGGNPVFSGTGGPTWDNRIRERGYILREDSTYKMWYTGFETEAKSLSVGYATSSDGINWERYEGNPVFDESWTEDMLVTKVGDTYHMFAEGRNDIAHRLSSADGISWTDHGSLDIRYTNGEPLSEGPYGTPTAWFENDVWYLMYERNDQGIWLATSEDLEVWQNVQDEPVIEMGPESYDKFGVAVNQVVRYNGWYYAYYHGTAFEDWSEWSTNVAASKDLVHWTKYPQNPIMKENRSSGILVPTDSGLTLYTMHDKVEVHFPAN